MYTYVVFFINGALNRRFQGVHVNTASKEEKEDFKKRSPILADKQLQEKGFIIASLDKSFFFYDTLIRRVWIKEGKRPIVIATGTNIHVCLVMSSD